MKRLFFVYVLMSLGFTGCGNGGPEDTVTASDTAPPAKSSAASSEKSQPGSAATQTGSGPCNMTVGWDPWEPYQYQDVDSNMRGLDIEILNEIAKRAGCRLSYQEGRWATLLRELQAGTIDMMTGATRTAARDSFAWFSAPYRDEDFELYVRAGEVDKYNVTDLVRLLDDGFRVGVTEQYVYGNMITALQENPTFSDQFVGATIGEINYARLMDFAIDGFLEDPFVASSYLRQKGLSSDIVKHPLTVHSGEVRFMFSKESVSEDVVKQMDGALADMRADGSYRDIIEKYLR